MGSRRGIARTAAVGAGVLVGLLAACGSSSPTPDRTATALGDDAITIGAFDFAESELLGELYGQALEHRGFAVQRAFGIGPREIVAPALARGLLELVPEYAGTALTFFSLGAAMPSADVATTHSALQQAVGPRHLTALAAAPAQNANDFVVTSETAQRDGIHSLTDVARVASQLTFGGPPECPRAPALPGRAEVAVTASSSTPC